MIKTRIEAVFARERRIIRGRCRMVVTDEGIILKEEVIINSHDIAVFGRGLVPLKKIVVLDENHMFSLMQ